MPERATPRKKSAASRVPAAARRRELLDEAAIILTEQGVEHLEISALAARVGVSRPLIYRQFPTRNALVHAVLEDFAALVNERFQKALLRALPGTVASITVAFVEASCDAIEQRGAGPWQLFDARGVDPELARLGRGIFARLLDPWQVQLAAFIGATPRRAAGLLWVIVAAGRAALDGWIEGRVTRADAVLDATTAISALLVAFTAPEGKGTPKGAEERTRRKARDRG